MVDRYAYRVVFSTEDNEWVGLCAEFPSLSHLAETQEDAFAGIVALVHAVVDDMAGAGEKLPEALSLKRYSGSFTARVAPHLHRALAIEAAEAGVSFNLLVNSKLCVPSLAAGLMPSAAASRRGQSRKREHDECVPG